MAGCRICKREMLTAQGCAIGTVHIGGKKYPRIKAGDARDFNPEMRDGERCGDCGAEKGFSITLGVMRSAARSAGCS